MCFEIVDYSTSKILALKWFWLNAGTGEKKITCSDLEILEIIKQIRFACQWIVLELLPFVQHKQLLQSMASNAPPWIHFPLLSNCKNEFLQKMLQQWITNVWRKNPFWVVSLFGSRGNEGHSTLIWSVKKNSVLRESHQFLHEIPDWWQPRGIWFSYRQLYRWFIVLQVRYYICLYVACRDVEMTPWHVYEFHLPGFIQGFQTDPIFCVELCLQGRRCEKDLVVPLK